MAIVIMGCGYIGLRIGQQLSKTENCYGLIRNPKNIKLLESYNIQPVIHDLDNTQPLPEIITSIDNIIFYLAPPDRDNLIDNRLNRVLSNFQSPPNKWIYISTSGVYGDQQGKWVSEKNPIAPKTDRAKRRAAAEQSLLSWHEKESAFITILRVPGIYGPSRLPIDKLREKTPIIAPAECPPTNLIHADDLATACIAAQQRAKAGEIYNVSDGTPITISEYYQKVAKLAGFAPPPEISFAAAKKAFSTTRLSFIEESRRLDVSKMQNNLKPNLQYQSLDKGIEASLL